MTETTEQVAERRARAFCSESWQWADCDACGKAWGDDSCYAINSVQAIAESDKEAGMRLISKAGVVSLYEDGYTDGVNVGIPAKHALVPVEPTKEMYIAGEDANHTTMDNASHGGGTMSAWKAMIAAAQEEAHERE